MCIRDSTRPRAARRWSWRARSSSSTLCVGGPCRTSVASGSCSATTLPMVASDLGDGCTRVLPAQPRLRASASSV
eukprot:5772922-Alexandrium_andersonii.AAC.1